MGSPSRNTKKNAGTSKRSKHGATTLADKGQRNSGERREPEHGGDVDEGFGNKVGRNTDRQVSSEEVGRMRGDPESAHGEGKEESDQSDRADKSELLSENGKDRVPHRLRKIGELLHALPEPSSEQSSGTYRHERLPYLVTFFLGCKRRIKKDLDAVEDIRPDIGEHSNGEDGNERHDEQVADTRPCRKKNSYDRDDYHTKCTDVGLCHEDENGA